MNSFSEQERRLAERLTALALDQETSKERQTQRWSRAVTHSAIGLALAAFSVGLIFFLVSPAKTQKQAMPAESQPVEVSAKPVPMPAGITGSGHVVATRVTHVFARFEGRIANLAVSLGDTVQAGDLLLQLEDPLVDLALQQARLALDTARLSLEGRDIDLKEAKANLLRARRLFAGNAIAAEALEKAETEADRAANRYAMAGSARREAELALATARERLAALEIRAPIAGSITALAAHPGDTVLAQADNRTETGLLTITDGKSQEIEAEIAEAAINQVHPGQRGEAVLDGDPGHPFPVTIRAVAPTASRDKGTLALRLTYRAAPDSIRPDMAVRIRLDAGAPPQQGEGASQ